MITLLKTVIKGGGEKQLGKEKAHIPTHSGTTDRASMSIHVVSVLQI